MGKRKRGHGPLGMETQPTEYEDRKQARINIDSFEDVPDEQDDFLSNREKILLEPESKRQQRLHKVDDEFLEHSDDEVLGYSDSDSSAAISDGADDKRQFVDDSDAESVDGSFTASNAPRQGRVHSEISDSDNDSLAEWGTSKAAYYNADDVDNEEDALAEEREARRLQQKRAAKLREADFGFDEGQWVSGIPSEAGVAAGDRAQDDQKDGEVHFEKIPQLQVTPDMSLEEQKTLLKRRYPELEVITRDLVDLQPLWQSFRGMDSEKVELTVTAGRPMSAAKVRLIKFRALSAYMGAMSMYLALLASPAQEASQTARAAYPLPPQELREHDVTDKVRQSRRVWEDVQHLEAEPLDEAESEDGTPSEEDEELPLADDDTKGDPGKEGARPKAPQKSPKSSRRAAALASTQASLAQLDRDLASIRSQSRAHPRPSVPAASAGNELNDLGDELPLDPSAQSAKAHRRKSLRFYTSQIAQRENKASGARARAAQGDEDLPYRERTRDRAERLNREAMKRGAGVDADASALLGGDEDAEEGDMGPTNAERDAHPDDNVDGALQPYLKHAAAKKRAKTQREAAYAEARRTKGHVVATRADGPEGAGDGHRAINYTIAANRGLTPKRKKSTKNPRVKKRMQYEDKAKRLRSTKPVFKGGEGRGGYAGELTGIKKGNVRSVKL